MKKPYILFIGNYIEGTIFTNGKTYDEVEVHVSFEDNKNIVDRMAMAVYTDDEGKYIDFRTTRYKGKLGKIYLPKENKGDAVFDENI